MSREWLLAEKNLRQIREGKLPQVAVIPTSAIEPHNLHLPYGQDWFQATRVAEEACRRAWAECPEVLCLPGIPYGVDANLMDFPLAMHISQATLDAVLRDLIKSLLHFGIRKVVVLNSHGGNDFTPLVRQIQADEDVHVFICNWWTVGNDVYGKIFEEPEDHAGELETSIGLHLYPELVEMDAAKDGAAKPYRFEALTKGWVKTSRRFARLNDHCAVGDPRKATADKGARYFDLVCGRIASFLVELARAEIDESFPHI